MIGISLSLALGSLGGKKKSPQMLVVDSFVTSGTWNSPITGNILARGWGGGGGGTAATGGGGGGAYGEKTIAVTPGSYPVVIGARQTGNGIDTTFDGTLLVIKGGKSGANGGAGGLASECTADAAYDGGDGEIGAATELGGGGAGSKGAAVADDPGEPNGGRGISGWSTYMGAGSGSTAVAGRHAARGEFRAEYLVEAVAGYPRFQGYAETRDAGGGTTSRAVIMPDDIAAGEMLVIAVACDGAAALNITMTGTGWAKRGQVINATSKCSLAIFYKTAEGSDTGTVLTSAAESCTIHAYRIADGGVPEMTTDVGATSTDPTAPGHTPSTGPGKFLVLAAVAVDATVYEPGAAPTGYDTWLSTPPEHSQGVQLLVAQKRIDGVSEGTAAFTMNSVSWCGVTVTIPLA